LAFTLICWLIIVVIFVVIRFGKNIRESSRSCRFFRDVEILSGRMLEKGAETLTLLSTLDRVTTLRRTIIVCRIAYRAITSLLKIIVIFRCLIIISEKLLNPSFIRNVKCLIVNHMHHVILRICLEIRIILRN